MVSQVGESVVPDFSSVNSIAVSGGNVFAGTFVDSVYVSTAANHSWNLVGGDPVPTIGGECGVIKSLVVSGDTVYASNGCNNVYSSTINGSTINGSTSTSWILIGQGPMPDSGSALFLALSGNNLYAASGSGGVYVADTSGIESWSMVGGEAIPTGTANSITVSGNSVYVADITGHVNVSVNNSAWVLVGGGPLPLSPLSPFMPFAGATSIAVSGNNLYVGALDGNVYLSANGESWVNTGYGNGSPVNSIALGN